MNFSFWRRRSAIWLVPTGSIALLLLLILGGRLYFQSQVNVGHLPANGNAIAAFWGETSKIELNPSLLQKISDIRKNISPLDGVLYSPTNQSRILAAVIDNHPAARAQMLGLVESPLVIEALAEGGITRYLAFFDRQELRAVGPIRSARPYFFDWTMEIADGLIHAGGSAEALKEIYHSTLIDFDQDNPSLSRDFRYFKPHNLFVDLTLAQQLVGERSRVSKLLQSRFDFTGTIPKDATSTTSITLNFSSASYLVNYIYDNATKKYQRLVGGNPHSDAKQNLVTPKNIIIQFTKYTLADTTTGHLNFQTVGTGEAWYFSQGKFWAGHWKKKDQMTEFWSPDGKKISLPAGQTFIEILGDPSLVTKS